MKVTLKKTPLYEAFDFDNDEEYFDIDVRKVRTSILVKELSELDNKLKQLNPSPLWFLETKHNVIAGLLIKSGPNHRVISIPMAKIKIDGRNVVVSSEGTFKIEKTTRYGKMTPISEMSDEMYNKVLSKLEDYIKDAKSFLEIKVREKVKKF